MTKDEFRILYALPPEMKVKKTQQRIREFYYHFGGSVFLSFSGGIDSTVLGHIIKSMGKPFSDIEFVFFDTHNEQPSVYDIVREWNATVISSPYTPQEVVEKVGYPLFNKELAHTMDAMKRGLNYAKNTKNPHNLELMEECRGRLKLFLEAPLMISDKCCTLSKKRPSAEFTKKTGKYPILATLATESYLRMQQYLKRGCNAFEGEIKSTPLGFWNKKDILWYIAQNDLKIADCYKAKISVYPLLGYKTCKLFGVERTGCLYCGFGKGIEFAKKVLKAKCPEYVAEHLQEFNDLH